MASGAIPPLHEDPDSPPERLLQAVWQQQRLIRDKLRTLDGKPVRVLHPGFRSVEGGPDFRGAVIQFGDDPPKAGNVEIDLRASGWRAHGHHVNPAFDGVILHVVWQAERPADGAPPAMPLRGALDAPLGELSLWLRSDGAEVLPEQLRGQCCAPLRGMESGRVIELLHEAARTRLEGKGVAFQARARQAGWEQALWEGLFRALGYKHNVWPMQRLAELRPRWLAGDDAQLLQARMFGISGLLPAELSGSRPDAHRHLRAVWDRWWRDRDQFADCVLPRTLWHLHGIRPANHPQRRVVLASQWASKADLVPALEQWCTHETAATSLPSSLLRILQGEPDEFWSWHWTFRSARLKHPQPLLGESRVTDLAVNVVLPWLWIRAVEGKNAAIQKEIERRYFTWPPAQDNAVLKLARQRLLGGAPPKALTGAAAQQGLLQIVRDFCEQTNALCENCKFPELVREWARR